MLMEKPIKLFEIIPEDFFRLLTKKHKNLYLKALFIVLDCFQNEITVRKEDLISLLVSALEEQIYNYSGDEDELNEANVSERAHALLRQLRDSKWIEIEPTVNSFDEYYILPDYSLRVITVLKEINDDQQKDYDSIVSSTYFTLRGVEMEKGEFAYDALVQTHRMTLELRDNLIKLLNNMRRYHQMVQDTMVAKDILEQHFDRYQESVNERIYHPLKTFDSVDRFKASITRILKSWLVDDQFIETMSARSKHSNKSFAQEEIFNQINEIIDIYTVMLPRLVKEIDRKNNAYIRATVQRFQYLTNRDRDFKGRIINILNTTKTSQSKEFHSEFEEFPIFQNDFVNDESLFKDNKRRQPHEPEIEVEQMIDQEKLNSEITELQEKSKRAFTRKKVFAFVNNLLDGNEQRLSYEITMNEMDDFVNTIASVIVHDEKDVPFDIEFLDGNVEINGYRIPNMRYKKREEK